MWPSPFLKGIVMIAEIDIMNTALQHIGQQPIVSVEDKSPQGLAAKLAWGIAFEDVMSGFDWTFATRYQALTKIVVENSAVLWEFTSSFYLPNDCMRVVAVQEATTADSWAVRNVEGAPALMTNTDTATLKYITDNVNLSGMSASFRLYLMARLAYHLDLMLAAGVNSQALNELIGRSREQAILYDASTHAIHKYEARELLDARQG